MSHEKVRGLIEICREGGILEMTAPDRRMGHLGYALGGVEAGYKQGGRYRRGSKDGPATWSRSAHEHIRPYFDCAGFVEALLYGCEFIDTDLFSHNRMRRVSRISKFYKNAALGDVEYRENWIPSTTRPATITELNQMGEWPQTPYLLFFREEFVEVNGLTSPHPGDCVFMLSKDSQGYHTHVGVWAQFDVGEGLVHCSPASKWDEKDGPKYTMQETDYWQKFLLPMTETWADMFGCHITRLRSLT
tara:strand:- start:101 stop:838 length:738 start_codon:yes stop_codon:yes gene_type:complete